MSDGAQGQQPGDPAAARPTGPVASTGSSTSTVRANRPGADRVTMNGAGIDSARIPSR